MVGKRVKKIQDVREEDRPREKISRAGTTNLNDRELIAAIIGRGTKGRDVYTVSRDIEQVIKEKGATVSTDDLLVIEGVGNGKASQICAAFELARRYLVTEDCKVTQPEDILPLVSYLKTKQQEYFICITLNGANEVIELREITKGLLNHSPVHPREVFADAITDRAASVLFVHNHPSGNPEPSSADIEITKTLQEAGDILGISVLDHIVIGKKGFVSLKSRGLLSLL